MKLKTDKDYEQIAIEGIAYDIKNGVIDIKEEHYEAVKVFGFNDYIEEEIIAVETPKIEVKTAIKRGKK